MALAAYLHGDVDDDDVDDDADPDEGGDEANVLGSGRAGEEQHRQRSLAAPAPACVVACGCRSEPPTADISTGAGSHSIAVPGEVPERLNGRDWKSRNGGNLVRGFESLPLRFAQLRRLRLAESSNETDRESRGR